MQKGFSEGSEVLNKHDIKTLANTYKYGTHQFLKQNNINKGIGSHFDDCSQKLTINNNINKFSEIKTSARLTDFISEDFISYTNFNQYHPKLLTYPGRPDGVIFNKNKEFISNYDLTEPNDINTQNVQNLNNFHENKLTKYYPGTKLFVFSNPQFEEIYNKINKNKDIILLSKPSKLENKIMEEKQELINKINELFKQIIKNQKIIEPIDLINELKNNSDFNKIFAEITVSENDLNKFLLESQNEIDDIHKKITY